MASYKGLRVNIYLLLASNLHVFFIQNAFFIAVISDVDSNWEKQSRELNESSSSLWINTNPALVMTVDPAGGQGVFTTVQAAINAVPGNNTKYTLINVKPGIYREKVTIPAEKPFIILSGSGTDKTVITWNDSAASSGGTYYSGTLFVEASDFVAQNLTIQNSFGMGQPGDDDQAVALRVSGDRCAFYNCKILGYQDTLLDESGRHYFLNCFIEGGVDFICGNGKSLYKNCTLHAIPAVTGAITAQKRMSSLEDSGFVFLFCILEGRGLSYLGRAWGPYSTVVYAYSYIPNITLPEGWNNWSDPGRQKTVYYGEYKCNGAGANRAGRVPWSRNLTDEEAAPYLSTSFINGPDNWIRKLPFSLKEIQI